MAPTLCRRKFDLTFGGAQGHRALAYIRGSETHGSFHMPPSRARNLLHRYAGRRGMDVGARFGRDR